MMEQRPWHRLFGLTWIDYFQGTAVEVETEMDLSLKQQFVDIVLIHAGSAPLPRLLPDGFEILGRHNLLTFKSYQEALDGWALCELVGHYVNYRKQVSPSLDNLLPESDFRLFAVCVRYPQQLAQEVELIPVRTGVYEVGLTGQRIRIIVVHQLPQEEQNAMLHLFSAKKDLLRYGKDHYGPRSTETSTLLYELFKTYKEDPEMSQKLQEFVRQSIDDLLKRLPAEERLKGLSIDELARALSPETLEALNRKTQATRPSEPPKPES